MAQDSEGLCSFVFANPTGILIKGDIKDPMEGVLDAPVLPDRLGEPKVFHMCWISQRTRPNSYRFMKSPITRSCICSVLEKHIVRRTNRLMRVRRLMCLLSIFCVFSFPT